MVQLYLVDRRRQIYPTILTFHIGLKARTNHDDKCFPKVDLQC